MKKILLSLTLIFGVALAICTGIYIYGGNKLFYTLAITFGTCFYHFAMRLCVGYGINGVYKNKMNYKKPWFSPKKWESGLYKLLRVAKWKKYVPTYAPETFKIDIHNMEQIVMVSCQAEIVHEIIMLLSFVPIAFFGVFDEVWAFVITSVLAALFDSIFVILQRYNRPRFLNHIKPKGK